MTDSFAEILRDWRDFFTFIGASATTLMGLMFVAVSLGSNLMKSEVNTSNIRAFVNPSIIHFITVLITAVIITIPTHNYFSLGSILGLAGVAGLVYVGIVSARLRKHLLNQNTLTRVDWFWRALMPAAGYFLIVIAAVGLLMHAPLILNSLALAVFIFLMLGIRNAWDLFLYIAQNH